MYTTILRLVWPYLQRYLAKQGAEYLQRRREQRLQQNGGETIDPGPPELAETVECPPADAGLAAVNAFWFTVSGVLLGSALTFILARLLKADR